MITIRDYDHYYARQYHQFDIRKESGGTLFSTSSDDGDTRYLRLTPYGKLDDGVSEDQINHGRQSIDSLSVPNLIDKFRDSEPRDHGTQHNKAKGINVNDVTFNTFRKQEQVIIDILGLLHLKKKFVKYYIFKSNQNIIFTIFYIEHNQCPRGFHKC